MARREPWTAPAPRPMADMHCPVDGCGRVMAQTDGRALYLATCSITRTVTLHCTRHGCSGRLTWHPSGYVYRGT